MKKILTVLAMLSVLIVPASASSGSWSIQDSTRLSLSHIYFVNDANGWIFTETDTILHTVDGGQSWAIQSSGSDYSITDVQFLDATTGYAVGDLGAILKTTDGGEHWTALNSGLYDLLVSVNFLDASTGWVVGEAGLIAKTTDGGATWESRNFPNEETEHQAVFFVDAQYGWISGALDEGAHVLRTTDGGSTWTTVLHDTTYGPMKSIWFTDAQNGWIGGMAGVILHTTDGGINWELQYRGVDGEQVRKIIFQDSHRGWAVGFNNAILFTENAGVDWYRLSLTTRKKLVDLCFSSPDNGWAITSLGGSSGGKGTGGEEGGDVGGDDSTATEKIAYILKWTPETAVIETTESPRVAGSNLLLGNYPNPFNPATTIRYMLGEATGAHVSLVIYDQLGRTVRTLVQNYQPTGQYSVVWDGRNDFSQRVSSGVYFYRLNTGEFRQTQKMLLLY